MLTGGQVADTSVFTCVLDEIRVPGRGQARTRPDRVLADKGYPSKKNRAWLRERGIKATIPERADQIEKRQKRPGRPIDFGNEQRERYKGRNVIERCFNAVKQWRGLASRFDKTARANLELEQLVFSPYLCVALLDKGTVDVDGRVTFQFRDGSTQVVAIKQ